jgi:DNA mismatch repair protein MutS2
VSAGQTVLIRSLGHRGLALEGGRDDDLIEVQVGILRSRVPVSDLELVTPTSPAFTLGASPPPARPPDAELQLVGLRAEEAAVRLEEYLFDALEAGLTQVRIIHGFGTGALRAMVRDVARHHPAVRAARAGGPGEGGGGVTIAEIGAPSD